jgi:hypothetical protein
MFTCPRCDRGFPSKSSLSSHAGHCSTETCPDCGKTVKTRDLDWHRRTVHNYKTPHEAFVAGLATQPPCIHGVPGGNIPRPDVGDPMTNMTGWMRCPNCRHDNAKRSAGARLCSICSQPLGDAYERLGRTTHPGCRVKTNGDR